MIANTDKMALFDHEFMMSVKEYTYTLYKSSIFYLTAYYINKRTLDLSIPSIGKNKLVFIKNMFEVCYWQPSKMGTKYHCECYCNLNLDHVVFFLLQVNVVLRGLVYLKLIKYSQSIPKSRRLLILKVIFINWWLFRNNFDNGKCYFSAVAMIEMQRSDRPHSRPLFYRDQRVY